MIEINTSSLDNLNFLLTYEEVSRASKATQDWIRRECQTNLRFLVNCVLRPRSNRVLSLTERVHGQLMDSFLKPSPDKKWDEWSPVKERVTLAFRGALKSTLVGGFLTQVILCDPDIRVQVLSGKMTHAETILSLGCTPFATNEVLRFLFPDWACDVDELSKGYFICPKRNLALNMRDPTLGIATFDSVKAGGHYELLVFDDCTNEINCSTPEMVEKNEGHYDDTDGLIEPGGYRHFFGTRWASDDSDLPEVIRRRGDVYAEDHDGEVNTTYYRLPVWMLRQADTPGEQQAIQERDEKNLLKQEDVTLTWPEKLTWKFLWPKYRANPAKFNKQYLLRFTGSKTVESFTRELMMENTRPYHEGVPRPHDRFLVVHWDLSGVYSGRQAKRNSDFTMGWAAMFEMSTRRVFYYDAILDVFNSSTSMATAIVNFYARQLKIHPVGACSIEDRTGARLLNGEIIEIARRLKVPINVNFVIQPSTYNIKNANIARLAGAAKQGKVQFATNLPQRDEIFRQFEKWSPSHKHAKDDAPDCAAQLYVEYVDKIFPGFVETMQPSDQTFFDPEPFTAPVAPDPHADERENADLALLESMTVGHV